MRGSYQTFDQLSPNGRHGAPPPAGPHVPRDAHGMWVPQPGVPPYGSDQWQQMHGTGFTSPSGRPMADLNNSHFLRQQQQQHALFPAAADGTGGGRPIPLAFMYSHTGNGNMGGMRVDAAAAYVRADEHTRRGVGISASPPPSAHLAAVMYLLTMYFFVMSLATFMGWNVPVAVFNVSVSRIVSHDMYFAAFAFFTSLVFVFAASHAELVPLTGAGLVACGVMVGVVNRSDGLRSVVPPGHSFVWEWLQCAWLVAWGVYVLVLYAGAKILSA